MIPLSFFASTALFAAFATEVLARFGWSERVFRGEEGRKVLAGSNSSKTPVIGGAVLLSSLALARLSFGTQAALGAGLGLPEAWIWAALLCAFGVGLGDDLFGFGPRIKLALQLLPGLCLAAPGGLAEGPSFQFVGWLCAAVLAQNAINTFDNADGAAGTLAAAGLFVPAPLASAALLGFLPFNLRQRPAGLRQRPILGDSGSHLLGVLVLVSPQAWPVFVLPLLDLARVAVLRIRLGLAPWSGDRRHLAHRLQLGGLGPLLVVAVLLLVATPTLLATLTSQLGSAPLPFALACTFTAGLLVFAVRRSPDPDRVHDASTTLRPRPPRTSALPSHRSVDALPELPRVPSPAPRERPRSASSHAS